MPTQWPKTIHGAVHPDLGVLAHNTLRRPESDEFLPTRWSTRHSQWCPSCIQQQVCRGRSSVGDHRKALLLLRHRKSRAMQGETAPGGYPDIDELIDGWRRKMARRATPNVP